MAEVQTVKETENFDAAGEDDAQNSPTEDEVEKEEDGVGEVAEKLSKKKKRGRSRSANSTPKANGPSKGRGRPKRAAVSQEEDDSSPKRKKKKIQKERTIAPGTLRDRPRLSYKDESSSEEEREFFGSDVSSDSEADYKLEKKLSKSVRPALKESGSLREKPRLSYKDDSASDIESGFESDVIPQRKPKSSKGRGRPKTKKTESVVSQKSPKGHSAKTSSHKRSRGRPKKEKSEEDEVEKSPKNKKSRGRPKGSKKKVRRGVHLQSKQKGRTGSGDVIEMESESTGGSDDDKADRTQSEADKGDNKHIDKKSKADGKESTEGQTNPSEKDKKEAKLRESSGTAEARSETMETNSESADD